MDKYEHRDWPERMVRGDVQEAYQHLKGRYCAATEVEARPCFQTMERQTAELVALYAQRTSPGEPLPINITLVPLQRGRRQPVAPADDAGHRGVGDRHDSSATGLDHRRPDTQRRRRLPRTWPAGADLEDHRASNQSTGWA